MIIPLPLAADPNLVQSVLNFFSQGGLFMWPLLICSMFAVTTIILRGFALRRRNVLPLVIESEIERLVPGGSAERLARIVHHDDSSLGRIARVALQHLRGPRSENIEAVETRARHEMVVLERGLIVLEIITGIAPLLGLIGAVSGLVHVFSHLGLSTGTADTKVIALGIAEALNATVFGLVHCRSGPGRVQLFLEKDRSDVGGNGNARGRADHEMLLRPRRVAAGARRRAVTSSGPDQTRADCSHARRLKRTRGITHEVRGAQTAGAINHHCLARRYPHDSAHFFRRLDHVQKRSAGSADQFAGVEDRDERAGRDRARHRHRESERRDHAR